MKPLRLLLLAFLVTTLAYAQQTITGRVVVKSTNAPIPQVNVRIGGSSAGTTTDESGRFVLKANDLGASAKLVFSHVGYQTQELTVAQLGGDVALEEQTYLIGEVTVSYGEVRKLLVKQWKIEEASLDAAAQKLLTNLRKREPEKAEKLAKRPDALRSALEMARYNFRDDGTVKAKILLFGTKLRWQLDEEKRILTIVDDEGNEGENTVVELTADRMVLKSTKSDAPPVAYVPTN